MKIQTFIQHYHTRDIHTDINLVYVSIDVYTYVHWMMPIMISYSDYTHFLINQMLLRPLMMSYNDESSLQLLLCNNWIIGCYIYHNIVKLSILLGNGEDSENYEKIESVHSIHIKTDEESDSVDNNIDNLTFPYTFPICATQKMTYYLIVTLFPIWLHNNSLTWLIFHLDII